MNEAYCSYEVTELLKEKGFSGDMNHYILHHNSDGTSEAIATCTHQLACAWLREVHDLYIEVVRGYDHFFVSINKMHPLREYSMKNDTFDDYDDAVEEALKYSLENLI